MLRAQIVAADPDLSLARAKRAPFVDRGQLTCEFPFSRSSTIVHTAIGGTQDRICRIGCDSVCSREVGNIRVPLSARATLPVEAFQALCSLSSPLHIPYSSDLSSLSLYAVDPDSTYELPVIHARAHPARLARNLKFDSCQRSDSFEQVVSRELLSVSTGTRRISRIDEPRRLYRTCALRIWVNLRFRLVVAPSRKTASKGQSL